MRKYGRLLSILFLSLLLAALIAAPTLAQDETPPGSVEEPAPPVEQEPVEQVPFEQVAAPAAAPGVGGWSGIYNLYATDGYVRLADGTAMYIYGFVGGDSGRPMVYQNSVVPPPGAPKTFVAGGLVDTTLGGTVPGTPWPTPTGGLKTGLEAQLAGNAQFPAPVIYAGVGDIVQINMKNLGVTNAKAPNDPHSIHLHGLDVNAANDGVPETSVGAVPANMAVPGAGNVIVYMFTAEKAGTYMYHCHQEASIHVQMGMYGALVVYDTGTYGARNGPGGPGTQWGWNYDKDYILLLSEIDTRQHVSEQKALGGGVAFNPINYQPQYWLINGLGFPNTIHASAGLAAPFTWSVWNWAHPGYDPFITGSVSASSTAGSPGEKVLLRVINMGFETQPMHMHGFHGKILGSDQHAWPWAQPSGPNVFDGVGLEKNTLTIGSGETYEWLLDFGTWTTKGAAGTYPSGTQTRYNALGPTSNTSTGDPAIPDPFVLGAAYVGGPVVGPDGLQGPAGLPPELPVTAGQYFPFHNHDDYKATNNGVYPGGMFTMIMTVP